MSISSIFNEQKAFFNANHTKSVNFRIHQLKKIKALLKENEAEMLEEIYADFGKSPFETYATEFALVYEELNTFIRKLKKWSKPRRVSTNLANFPAKSELRPEPLGVTLIIGPWNYPYQLSLLPAITAIAAGNTVILKPSELPIATSNIMAKIINKNFESNFFHVVEGGIPETTELLDLPFDKIFFTGSIPVGKIVYQAAAKNLTPVTLELGGKSPTIITASANLKLTAKRLIWAKFINAGQTCIAPDYILVEKKIEQALLEALKEEIEANYDFSNDWPENYLQIINDRNFERLQGLIPEEKIYFGGTTNSDKRIIQPTLLNNISFEDKVMEDEIFGPILPVISYEDIDWAIAQIKSKPKPLSLYIYSKDKTTVEKVLNEVSFGGGAVNDSVMHIANPNLPFGGVGFSGIGAYHNKAGFDTFTHYKGILKKRFWFEPSIKYAPYKDWKLKILKWLMG